MGGKSQHGGAEGGGEPTTVATFHALPTNAPRDQISRAGGPLTLIYIYIYIYIYIHTRFRLGVVLNRGKPCVASSVSQCVFAIGLLTCCVTTSLSEPTEAAGIWWILMEGSVVVLIRLLSSLFLRLYVDVVVISSLFHREFGIILY